MENSLRHSLPSKQVYWVPEDDLAGEVLVRAFAGCESVDCMAGFFDSGSFASIAPGIAAFVNDGEGSMRFLVSPRLAPDDLAALEEGTARPEEVLERALAFLLDERGDLLASAIKRHQLDCLAYLLATGRLEIRVVVVRRALFHPKTWVFRDGDDEFMVLGSANSTEPGITRNIEVMTLVRSWTSLDAAEAIEGITEKFEKLWEDDLTYSRTFTLPESIANGMLKRGLEMDSAPTIESFWGSWSESGDQGGSDDQAKVKIPSQALRLPDQAWGEGSWSHQLLAVEAWEKAGHRGVLSMATGSGKTVTALVAATRLQDELRAPLLIVVTVPTNPLVEQWTEEVARFSIRARGQDQWSEALRHLRFRASQTEVVVVTNDFLRLERNSELLSEAARLAPVLFIADEVHRLASDRFVDTIDRYEPVHYRMGLSATPEKFSEDQTDAIWAYFGDVVYEFSLADAITAGCLVPYEYHLYPVDLEPQELDDYAELSAALGKAIAINKDRSGLGKLAAQLAAERHKVIETAAQKLPLLREVLREHHHLGQFKQALIYATSKAPEQLSAISNFMNSDGYYHRQLTADESSNRALVRQLLSDLALGKLQAITCKKVLDEGISVPDVRRAYLVASGASSREWVQRRGRVLRKAEGKDRAYLFDFAVLPDKDADEHSRKIRAQEVDRIAAFAQDAHWGGAEALAAL